MSTVYQSRFNLNVYGKRQPSRETVTSLCSIADCLCTHAEQYSGPIGHWSYYLYQQKRLFGALYKQRHVSNVCLTNFDLIRTISKCEFGRVILAVLKSTDDCYAIKAMQRAQVVKKKMVHQVINTKQLLHCIKFPFIISCEFSFKDNNLLYMAMPYIRGPNLMYALMQLKRLNESDARFFAGQVVLALEYLHNINLIYRALKLENLLLDDHGYIKLIGFEQSKLVPNFRRTYTVCGTIDYIAPEITLGMGYHKSVDWWTFGVLLYELCSGRTPFSGKDISDKFSNICSGKYHMDPAFSLQLKELIFNLLQTDPTKRLGNLAGGVDTIKNHLWFNNLDFLLLVNRRISAPKLRLKIEKQFIQEENVLLDNVELYSDEFKEF